MLCVNKSGAVLRASAKSSAPLSWRVPKYMPLQPTGARVGGWLEVTDVDDQKHWVHSSDVTSKLKCLVVTAKRFTLRSGPGSKYSASDVGLADRYSAFIDLGGEDGWTQIQDEGGNKAWVSLDVVWRPQKKLRMSFSPDT